MRIFLLAASLILFTPFAQADELLETYVAKLSSADHFNSKGQRLTSPAAIIRQDRANYHRFGKADSQDEWDAFFVKKANRALLEQMLNNGFISKATRRAIVNGTPVITVRIYSNHVEVTIE